uniref:Uncharacterized protein n=1 Tax=Ixodes ricinus TaxID=34613 RepID=A0A6B0U702_IXORI
MRREISCSILFAMASFRRARCRLKSRRVARLQRQKTRTIRHISRGITANPSKYCLMNKGRPCPTWTDLLKNVGWRRLKTST